MFYEQQRSSLRKRKGNGEMNHVKNLFFSCFSHIQMKKTGFQKYMFHIFIRTYKTIENFSWSSNFHMI